MVPFLPDVSEDVTPMVPFLPDVDMFKELRKFFIFE
jgi:hypothetical protein